MKKCPRRQHQRLGQCFLTKNRFSVKKCRRRQRQRLVQCFFKKEDHFLIKNAAGGSAEDSDNVFSKNNVIFREKLPPEAAPKTRKTFNYKKGSFFVKNCRRRQRQRLGRLLITIASLNWTPVRALEAFIAANCMTFRPGSNGNTPGPPKSTNKKY